MKKPLAVMLFVAVSFSAFGQSRTLYAEIERAMKAKQTGLTVAIIGAVATGAGTAIVTTGTPLGIVLAVAGGFAVLYGTLTWFDGVITSAVLKHRYYEGEGGVLDGDPAPVDGR